MKHKTFPIEIKEAPDEITGAFQALVAVFDNVDLVGDRIMKGAFKTSLRKWRESGDPIPVILSHKADDPMAHIGVANPHDVVETQKGLLVKGQLDITDNAVAKQVHKLMSRRSLKEFSFGYTVPKGGEHQAEDGANELTEIDVFEIGPTLKGANPSTELHAVKSALEPIGEEEGRRLVAAVDQELVEDKVKQLVGEELWEQHHDNPDELRAEIDRVLHPPVTASPEHVLNRRQLEAIRKQLGGISKEDEARIVGSVLVEERIKGLVGEELWDKHHNDPDALRAEVQEALKRPELTPEAEAEVKADVELVQAELRAIVGEKAWERHQGDEAALRKEVQDALARHTEQPAQVSPEAHAAVQADVEAVVAKVKAIVGEKAWERHQGDETALRTEVQEALERHTDRAPEFSAKAAAQVKADVEAVQAQVKAIVGDEAWERHSGDEIALRGEVQQALKRHTEDPPELSAKAKADVEADVERVQAQVKQIVGEATWDRYKSDDGAVRRELQEGQAALQALEMFDPGEVEGLRNGQLKAIWSAEYLADLPDSSFLHVEPGAKDEDGKTTPRDLRHFAHKDANGKVDVPHVRNALSRIPQSSLPHEVKDRLALRAQRILDNAESRPVSTGSSTSSNGGKGIDPLRAQADALTLEFASGGLSLHKPPQAKSSQERPNPPSADELRRKATEQYAQLLTGDIPV